MLLRNKEGRISVLKQKVLRLFKNALLTAKFI